LDGLTAQASTRYATNRAIGYARCIDHQTHSLESIRPSGLTSAVAEGGIHGARQRHPAGPGSN